MKHLAAYMLCTLGGNAAPTNKDVQKVLSSVGIEADNERLAKMMELLSGKNVNQVFIHDYF
jgi:large subunit ribosomal protein LP2